MNQEKVSNFIKEIRKKDNLTQEKFAEKYGVTYQAVSKWENGKNLPDIEILKQMCNDYNTNINDLLNGTKKKNNYIYIVVSALVLILLIIFLIINNRNNFEMKKIKANCSNFELYGVVAYNSNKTSIHISNITYCGNKDENLYSKIECVLYEKIGNTKKEIKTFKYDSKPILLNEYLKDIDFNIEHYSKNCQMYKDGVLRLEIKASNENGTTYYEVPLKMEKC